jgi:DNA-binding XRE family transcriptional regulator
MFGPDTNWAYEIKAFRLRNSMKQGVLAELVGVETPTVSRWERGRDKPSLGYQKILAKLILPPPTIGALGLLDIVETTDDIAVLMDREFRIVAASPGHRKLLRYDLSDIAGIRFPMWTEAMFQTMQPIGGPPGWWTNGIRRIDFSIVRQPGERAKNPMPIYQQVSTLTVQDGTGDKYRYAITKTIKESQFIAGPPRIVTF